VIGGSTTLVAQMPGLCDPANRPSGWIDGAFEIEGNITSGCGPMSIKVNDRSNGTDLRYDFSYTGSGINAFPATMDILPATDQAKTYTILQYGEKEGKIMVACKQVTVLPKIQYSVSACDDDIQVQLPSQPEVVGFSYKYKINNGPEKEVQHSQLPYNSARNTVTFPVQVEVYASNSSGVKTCVSPPETILSRYHNPHATEITRLEMLEGNKAELTLNGSFGDPYKMYFAESTNDIFQYEMNETIQPGTKIYNIPDETKSYCFMAIQQSTSCAAERSSVVCTIPVDSIQYSVSENILSWQNHRPTVYGEPTDPRGISRTMKTELLIETVNESLNPMLIPLITSSYTHTIDCRKNYCYQIIATLDDVLSPRNHKAESRSLKRCISRKDIKAPPITTLYTSVDGDKVAVNFTDDAGWPLSKPYFFLYHSPNGNFTKADSTNSTNSFQYTLQDPNQQSLCFKVGYIDQCGSHSQLSPEVCTLHLTYVDPDLAWSSENPFSPRAIGTYEIEEVLPNTANVGSTSPNVHTFTPDFGDQELEITYRIKAIDSNGNFSFSNVLSVLPVFGIYLPTAFSPNGDFLNEDLILKGKKGMIKDFSLEIFDRDRNKIYSTQDKDFSWNGKINDEAMSPGTYSLFIKASLINGEVITLTEIITILY
jgi:gliding motility-associated-like protein